MSVASPNPSEQGGNKGEIAYRFCQECSNLLYPREDRQLNRLLYICKACQFVQEHDSACTYRQVLSEAAQESMGEKAHVSQDPTVSDPRHDEEEEEPMFCTRCGERLPHERRECPKCHEENVVYFQSQQRKGDIGMSLYYVCTNPACNHSWKNN